MEGPGGDPFDGRHSWAVQAGADKILAAEDMREYAIFSLDAEGRVASWNTGAERLNGYRSDQIVGRHFAQFYLREQAESRYPQWELEQAAANGFYIDRGWRVRADGSRFWAHVVITAQRAPGGQLHGFIKVVRNESEVEARQQRSHRRFTDLFELASAAVALFDGSGRFLEANGALCDLLGYRRGQLLALGGQDLLHPDDAGERLVPPPSDAAPGDGLPIPHRVLVRSTGEPVRCQLHSAASVRDDGSRSWLVVFNDVTAHVRTAEKLRHQATHDELTGLPNRRGIEEHLAELLGTGPDGIAVLHCDLDNFKRVNDALGHEAGDELLVAVADRIAHRLPPKCSAARLYGDQFAIACADLRAVGGIEVLERAITEACCTTVPLRKRHVRVSASVGSAVAAEPTTVSALLRKAEAATERRRMRGRRHATAVRGETRPALAGTDQLALEEDLRAALEADDLQLHYQPVVAEDGSVPLAEALLRWQHPRLGRLAPDLVLDVAERGGLLPELDRCVLRTALCEAASWRRPDGAPVGISVNLAGLRPEQDDFVATVSDEIRQSGVRPQEVVLEMVETVLAALGSESRQAMAELVETGVRFAVDDFGTGYSSFARLRELPAQIVKLDRSFISGVGVDPADLGIVRSMNELVRTLGRRCIAEGVETGTQRHLLRSIGVEVYQGYLFAKPLPADEFRAFLAEECRAG